MRTGFHVVDPQVEAAQARLEAMRTGRHLKIKKPMPPVANKPKGKVTNVARRVARTQINFPS